VVLPGVRIGKGAMIAAGAVVSKDVPAGMLYGASNKMAPIGNEDGKAPSAGMGFSNGGGDRVELGLWIVNEERGRGLNPKENPIPKDNTYSKKFHRFGFQWGPADYRWYVDGRLTYTIRISDKIPATPKPMYISFDHNRLPEAGLLKSFKDPNLGPEPMRVDWVKVYQ
jgi:hypothetical protein